MTNVTYQEAKVELNVSIDTLKRYIERCDDLKTFIRQKKSSSCCFGKTNFNRSYRHKYIVDFEKFKLLFNKYKEETKETKLRNRVGSVYSKMTNNAGWNLTSLMCYQLGCNCRLCHLKEIYTETLEVCHMGKRVEYLLRIKGKPKTDEYGNLICDEVAN